MLGPSPLFILIFGLAIAAPLIVLVWVLMLRFRIREIRHKEQMAAIEKGIALPAAEDPYVGAARVYLLRGLIWLFVGIGVVLFLLVLSFGTRVPEGQIEWATPAGLDSAAPQPPPGSPLPASSASERIAKGDYFYPVPPAFAAVGFIPLGVGIAYLIFYRSESKRP